MSSTEVQVSETCGSDQVNNFDYNKLKDRKYKGEDYVVDKKIGEGLGPERRCTDCLFLIVWITFLIAMMWMTIDGYVNGHANEMLAPVSRSGQICGFTNGTENYKWLYIPDLNHAMVNPSLFFTNGYCAESCPNQVGYNVSCVGANPSSSVNPCANTLGQESYDTFTLLNYCLPTAQSIVNATGSDSVNSLTTSNYFISMYESRWAIVSCIFIALVLALIYIKLMDWLAVYIAWITIVVIEIALVVMGVLSYNYAQSIINTDGRDSASASALFVASICWIFAAIFYLIMFCNWRSLRISIAIIETAADFFADTKRIIFMPLLYFTVWVLIFVFWLWGVSGVASITDSEIVADSVILQTKTVNRSEGTNWMIAGMFFGMVWISAFIMAANEFTVICAAVSWYYSRKDIPDDDGIPGDADVTAGLWWTYRYHMGTLAFGSFILTTIWLIRATLEYLGEKLHEASAKNKCTECMLCCMRCCLDCFDRFVRFLNQNAYIYSAVTSESFCPSALHSFLLILKNAAKFSFVEGIAGSFMFLAKCFVAISTTMIGYSILPPMTAPIIVNPTMPCIFIFLFSYLVASSFISIFDVSSVTILQCYLFDVDLQKHHGLDMKHVPPTLLKFLQVHAEETKGQAGMDDEAKQNLMS